MGLIIAVVDLRIDGFDLFVDVVGFALIAHGSLALSDGSVSMPKRASVAFRVVLWASVISAGFAMNSIVASGAHRADGFEVWSAPAQMSGLSALAASAAELAVVWYLLSAIMLAAAAQEAAGLYTKASQVRRTFTVIYLLGTVLVALLGVDLGPFALLLLMAFFWIGFRLFQTIFDARAQLSLPVYTIPDQSNPSRLSPVHRIVFGLAVVIVAWSLLNPPQSSHLEDQLAAPADFLEAGANPLSGPTPVDLAVERQPPVLVQPPAALSPTTGSQSACEALARPLLVALDIASGERLWELQIPSIEQPPALADDETVLVTDPRLDELLPSVSAISIETGAVRWQRYIEGLEISPWGSADGKATYEVSNPWAPEGVARLTTLDAGGGIFEETASGVGEWSDLPDSRFFQGAETVKVSVGDGSGYQPHLWLRRADGSLLQGDRVPLDNVYNRLGNRNSLGDEIQLGHQTTLVVLGSSTGPNSKVVAYDNSTGRQLWSKEHLRSAAVATLNGRDVVVYDRRNTKSSDAPSTRHLYVAEATDPDDVLWSAELSVNDDGGNGFLGSTGQALVFATPREGAFSGEPAVRFAVIARELDAPEYLSAAEGYGGGPSSRHYVSGELVMAAVGEQVLIQRSDGSHTVLDLDAPVHHLSLSGSALLAVTGQPAGYCS